MSRIITLSTVMALAMSTPMLLANNAPMLRAMPANLISGVQARGNCDIMASNTVTASFVGLKDLAVQRIDQDAPSTVQVAVFQVVDSLGYHKFNYIGDGRLTPGMSFTIAMNRELPGQPAENVDTIAQLQAGEQVIMRVDHLYLITGQEGESIRVCSRIARRGAAPQAPAAAPQAPTASPAPIHISAPVSQPGNQGVSMQMSSRSFSMSTDSNGQMRTIQTSRVYDPNTGEIRTRMKINGVEVDPVTKQPLVQPLAQPATQAAPPAATEAQPGQPEQQQAAPSAAPAAQAPDSGVLPPSECF